MVTAYCYSWHQPSFLEKFLLKSFIIALSHCSPLWGIANIISQETSPTIVQRQTLVCYLVHGKVLGIISREVSAEMVKHCSLVFGCCSWRGSKHHFWWNFHRNCLLSLSFPCSGSGGVSRHNFCGNFWRNCSSLLSISRIYILIFH